MGASQEKKKRLEAKNSGEVKINERELEEQKKNRIFKITAIVTAVVLVLSVILILIIRSNIIYHNVAAVTIDDVKYTAADYNYFRQVKVKEYEGMFGDLTNFKDMITDNVIKNATLDSMKSTTMYCSLAEEAGYNLSEDAQTKIDDAVSTLKSYTNMMGTNFDSYLQTTYGTGVTEEVYRKNAARIALSEEYRNVLVEDLHYSDEFLEENYDPSQNDIIGYYLFTTYNSSQENEDTAAEDARAKAEEFASKVTGPESFEELVKEYSTGYIKMLYKYDPKSCLMHSAGKSINEAYYDWLMDPARKNGDMDVFSDEIGSYVVYYIDRSENDYYPVSIREIFFPHNVSYTDYDNDADYEEAYQKALETAHTSAEQVYNSWLEGEKTEDSFGKLAQAYNTSGLTADYGLIEVVMKNVYNEAIDEWCFDPARQEGDTEIIDTPNGSYIIYFIGEYPQTYRQYVIDLDLRTNEFKEWEEEALSAYEVKEGFGMHFAD